ncbi:MAG: hypothetical protein E5Y65_30960 [Mesorhizobium sp.]|uniref:hypothetical protein n=1 Tax=Mesorhizobium sp. TaxID=1871066 RepID=UPI0012024DC7|nr:hypothetical protein [Mesorhizobium sp.]TIL85156.1 MAG: hypothetical protein E5Y65_30960 [Mesorhizobium sp.]TIL97829.1 MAG: hypothetical protein E5Y64_28880 [Mesorhizobium sp.]TIN16332.1 MAG: hypothetical protein E5Y59_09850 [Mesorhizobium sp.]
MAQAIQHKGETVAKLREGEEWVVVGTKIERHGLSHVDTVHVDELHPNAAGSLRHATYNAECLRQMVRRGLFDA